MITEEPRKTAILSHFYLMNIIGWICLKMAVKSDFEVLGDGKTCCQL